MNSVRWIIWISGAVAAVSLALLLFGAVGLTGDPRTIVTWLFWISFIVLVIALYVRYRREPGADEIEVDGPPFARFLFNNRAAGWVWLPIRVFLGFAWLDAGIHKLNDPGWVQGGTALLKYWQGAVALPGAPARPAITYDWYRDFINLLINNHSEGWFAVLITFGEIAVGIALIVGAMTGIAAFFGALMNVSYLLAGSTSSNPVLFTLAIGVVLAWKVAGYYGLDRYLLPRLGTPWRVGTVFHRGAPRTLETPPG